MERIIEGSRLPNGRIMGWVYLLYFLTATAGGFLINRVVATDHAATITNLLAHEPTYRAGFAFGLVGNVVYVALTVLFYRLLKPVNPTLSLLMASASLIGCTTQIVAGLLQLAPLVILRDRQLLAAFPIGQLQAAALVSLRIYSQAFHISFVLFAVFDYPFNQLGVKRLFGHVPEDNHGARLFNQKMGFQYVARIEGVFKHGIACLVMRLDREQCRFLTVRPRTIMSNKPVH